MRRLPHRPGTERRGAAAAVPGQLREGRPRDHLPRAAQARPASVEPPAAGRQADRTGDLNTAVGCYETAGQLYQGDFLADEPYLEWAASIRDRLRLEAVQTQSRLLAVYLDRGEYGAATLLGRRLLALDPCNEPVHRQLMSCYAASGQRHLALGQYHQASAALWRDFRIRPAAETTALYEWLRPSRVRAPP